jgi:hypothetical protein
MTMISKQNFDIYVNNYSKDNPILDVYQKESIRLNKEMKNIGIITINNVNNLTLMDSDNSLNTIMEDINRNVEKI